MSYAYNQRKKARRRKLFEILPELAVVWMFIRKKGVPRWTRTKQFFGRYAYRSTGVRVAGLTSTFGVELRKALKSRHRADGTPVIP